MASSGELFRRFRTRLQGTGGSPFEPLLLVVPDEVAGMSRLHVSRAEGVLIGRAHVHEGYVIAPLLVLGQRGLFVSSSMISRRVVVGQVTSLAPHFRTATVRLVDGHR